MLDLPGLHFRAALFSSIRSFFRNEGFLEVDTPVRQPVIIPEANIIAVEAEGGFLQTSPELYMKRLLAAGCSSIFQLCPCFRKEERGSLHLEEFTMLEWYRSGHDYTSLMEDCERLIAFLARSLLETCAADSLEYQAVTAFQRKISTGWERVTVQEAFERYAPVGVYGALEEGRFEEVLVEHVEPELGKYHPVILYDYPVVLGSLARTKPEDPSLAERFELYIGGVELANGFSELTDAFEQRQRFEAEIAAIQRGRGLDMTMPERFLEDIGKIETAAGIALGVDRLFMQLTGVSDISSVRTFSPEEMAE